MPRRLRRLLLAAATVSALAWAAPATASASVDPACAPVAAAGTKALAGGDEGVYSIARTPNDPLFADQWALRDDRLAARRAWDVTTGARGVTVAVVDTGVRLDSRAIAPNLALNPGETGNGRETNGLDDDGNGFVDDWRGWDFAGGDNDPRDANGHGTHVAGIIGARGDDASGVAGVAWEVGLLPLQVLGADGSGDTYAVARAIRYAAARGARVVNLSLGSRDASDSVLAAICAAPDVLVVAAAGNSGSDVDRTPFYPCALPLANVICVAASDHDDALAAFSSRGATTVDLAAPGAGILGLGLGAEPAVYSGTSMAAPHVSGVAALIWSAHPDWSVAQVRDAILSGTDPVPALRGRVATGGRLNAARALAAAVPATPARPATPAPGSRRAARVRVLRPQSVRRTGRLLRVAVRVPVAGRLTLTVAARGLRAATVARVTRRVARPGRTVVTLRLPARSLRAGRALGVQIRLAPARV